MTYRNRGAEWWARAAPARARRALAGSELERRDDLLLAAHDTRQDDGVAADLGAERGLGKLLDQIVRNQQRGFFLDDVELNLEPGADVPWLAEDPTAGVVPADSIINVTITYNSTGLANGNYFATLRVKNPPAAAINIPVTLHVTDLLNDLYLPLILK